MFARERAKVVICDVSAELGNEVVKMLGPDARFYKVDVTNRAEVQQWVDDVVARFGRVDILVNNAGPASPATLIYQPFYSLFLILVPQPLYLPDTDPQAFCCQSLGYLSFCQLAHHFCPFDLFFAHRA